MAHIIEGRLARAAVGLMSLLLVPGSLRAQLPPPLPAPAMEVREVRVVRAVADLPDGGRLVFGDFGLIGGLPRAGVVRIAADGGIAGNVPLNVVGLVRAARVHDGWLYLAGSFAAVNGQPRRGLARVAWPSGALDGWNPNAGSTAAYDFIDIVLDAGHAYVGGEFSQVGTTPRTRLARIGLAGTGAVDPAWSPSANGRVLSLALRDPGLYFAGHFTEVSGQPRSFVAMVVAATGMPAAFAPAFNGHVTDIEFDGPLLYAVGCFTQVGAFLRPRAAAVHVDGTVAAFAPQVEGTCLTSIHLSASHAYLGGEMVLVAGQPRSGLARVQKATGLLDQAFAPALGLGRYVFFSSELQDGSVLVGHDFLRASGAYHPMLVRLSGSSGQPLAPSLASEGDGSITAMVELPDQSIILGGTFSRLGTVPRKGLARLTPQGELDPGPMPEVRGNVHALATDGSFVWVGGAFDRLGNFAVQGLGKLQVGTWQVQSDFNAPVAGAVEVLSLAPDGLVLTLGGGFSQVAGQPRTGLAKVHRSNGTPLPWAPQVSGSPRALAEEGGAVYVGGSFSAVNGTPRSNLARLDAGGLGNLVHGFVADTDGPVNSLRLGPGDGLYVGGSFANVAGQPNRALARVLRSSGQVDPSFAVTVAPAGASVHALIADAAGVLVAGSFTSVSGTPRANIARLDHLGQPDPSYSAQPNGMVTRLAVTPARILMAGFFTGVSNQLRFRLAATATQASPVATSLQVLARTPSSTVPYQWSRVDVVLTTPDHPGLALPAGALFEVSDDQGNYCQGSINPGNGQGSCELLLTDPGPRVLTGRFPGRGLYLPSSGTLAALVEPATATPPLAPALPLRSSGLVFYGQPMNDGGVMLSGSFIEAGGLSRNSLARLTPGGALDTTFAPQVRGTVTLLARDDAGNLYLRGNFTAIDGVLRRHLARLRPDGSLDPDWRAPDDLCLGGTMFHDADQQGGLLVQGCAELVQVAPPGTNYWRAPVLRLDPVTGALDPGFQVMLRNDANLPQLRRVHRHGGHVYLAGNFLAVNGTPRQGLARLGPGGMLDPAWAPAVQGTVWAVRGAGSDLFIGGEFSHVDGQPRQNLARIDGNGVLVPGFQPSVDRSVERIVVVGDTLYIAGNFSEVAGLSRRHLARLDAATGVPDAAFVLDGENAASGALLLQGGTLLYGTGQRRIGGVDRFGLVRLDAGTAQALPGPDFLAPPRIHVLARDIDGGLLVGGGLMVPGTSHRGLVRIRPDGLLDSGFLVEVDAFVYALVVLSGGDLLVGGNFTRVGSQPRTGIARLDRTGAARPGWDIALDMPPPARPGVYALHLDGDHAIVAGQLGTADGVARGALARVALADGALDPAWHAGIDTGQVLALAADGAGGLLVGGNFTQVAGQPRQNLARLDLATAALDAAWSANANSLVRSLLVHDGALFVGGNFGSIGGVSRDYLARLTTAGTVTAWDAQVGGSSFRVVHVLAADGPGRLLAGGQFRRIGGGWFSNVARLDTTSAQAAPAWNPSPDGPVLALLPASPAPDRNGEEAVVLGGEFHYVGGVERPGVVVVPAEPLVPLDAIFCSGFEAGPCGQAAAALSEMVR